MLRLISVHIPSLAITIDLPLRKVPAYNTHYYKQYKGCLFKQSIKMEIKPCGILLCKQVLNFFFPSSMVQTLQWRQMEFYLHCSKYSIECDLPGSLFSDQVWKTASSLYTYLLLQICLQEGRRIFYFYVVVQSVIDIYLHKCSTITFMCAVHIHQRSVV